MSQKMVTSVIIGEQQVFSNKKIKSKVITNNMSGADNQQETPPAAGDPQRLYARETRRGRMKHFASFII
jgi:hypothetical protein